MQAEEWNDWRWQSRNSIVDAEKVYGRPVPVVFRMRIPPYYGSLMSEEDSCPIRRQAVPAEEETQCGADYWEEYGIDRRDSLAEKRYMPVRHLVHRYPDRVMLEATSSCFMYCRFCTRKRLTGKGEGKNDLKDAIGYIERNRNIRDVLISGGDPLTLEDNEIESVVSALRSINHVEIIRIGTRAPAVMPMRVTDGLVQMLRRYHPIWINTHFNHPKELTREAGLACGRIVDAGIPLGNQSVLLKGVNDEIGIMRELCLKLVQMRVRPYYLYQCDIGIGSEHFRTKVQKGMEIISGLRQNISGLAVPNFVIDAPNGGGKIVVHPDNVVEWNERFIRLRNAAGKEFIYPEVQRG